MTLRMIPGGAGQPQPWNQRPDEDEAEYMLFLYWLQKPCPRPLTEYPKIAMQFEWSERANAYDAAHSLPSTPKDQLSQMLADALTFGALEMRKHMNDSRKQSTPVSNMRELVTLMYALVENKGALERALADDVDLDLNQLTDDEMRAVLEAKRAITKIGGRK